MSKIYTKISKKINRIIGHKFTCPICTTTAPFDTYGIKPRKNALCYHCNSLERHRFFYLFLENQNLLCNRKAKILHIAPESNLTKIFKNNWKENYVTGDLYDKNVDLKIDITKINQEDESFDHVFCNHVLEHVENDALALQEMFRILKKGGSALITVPIIQKTTYENPSITSKEERLKTFGQSDHVRNYGIDIIERMKAANFTVETIYPSSFLSAEQIINNALPRDATGEIFLCKK
jgi:SAM-dependent methyltransferase